MLKNLSSRYGQKIKSYMKLNDDPDVAEIFLVDKKLLSEDEGSWFAFLRMLFFVRVIPKCQLEILRTRVFAVNPSCA